MVIEPAYLTKKIAELQHSFGIYCRSGMITYVGGFLTCGSFFTLTAIAVDRYLVVHSGTKYKTIVTNTRVTWVIITLWVLSGTLFSAQLYASRDLYFKLTAAFMVGCFVIASFCYIKCFLTLRKQKREVNTFLKVNSTQQGITNVQRYKKSIYTMLYIFLIFNLCYLPYLCTAGSAGILGESAAIWGAESLSAVIILANSLINPIILFWRMKEIRKAVSSTISIIHYSQGRHCAGKSFSNQQVQIQHLHIKHLNNI
ncbi:melanocyte-stimulating hormone receptor-like [Actinia tenebrosa]|uniref:Melanocyte-stimulating hormone receptor-like n=1 Tax=Actinia tenebrosa TaxID=6105 RepID=A0A6P8I9G8_ACTTE|nr:melanocyte-stimulating hormone receptor-like [Actinia tenebrosa]